MLCINLMHKHISYMKIMAETPETVDGHRICLSFQPQILVDKHKLFIQTRRDWWVLFAPRHVLCEVVNILFRQLLLRKLK